MVNRSNDNMPDNAPSSEGVRKVPDARLRRNEVSQLRERNLLLSRMSEMQISHAWLAKETSPQVPLIDLVMFLHGAGRLTSSQILAVSRAIDREETRRSYRHTSRFQRRAEEQR
jgi:hypothetical protein